MNNPILKQLFSKKISAHSEKLVKSMIDSMLDYYQYRFTDKQQEEYTYAVFTECIEIIAEGLLNGEIKRRASDWGENLGRGSLANGGELGRSIKAVTIYKKVLWTFIQEESRKVDCTFEEILEIISDIDYIFNLMVHGFSNAFTKNAEVLLKQSEQLFLKISVPIVPISKSLAILPLIGEINEMRSEILIQDTLNACVKKRFETIVIDLSGVHTVDLFGIEVIFKLIRTLNLLGVHPVITGMLPDLSLTFVNLGIALDNVDIYPSLEQALKNLHLN